jgi:pectate lyase
VSVRNFNLTSVRRVAEKKMTEYSNNVWIDHVDVSSDMDHDKDYYDGLIDVRILPYPGNSRNLLTLP